MIIATTALSAQTGTPISPPYHIFNRDRSTLRLEGGFRGGIELRTRAGISRVAITAVLLVLGVAAAGMVFVLTRGALLHFVGLAESRTPRSNIEIVPPGLNNSGGVTYVFLRNLGPDPLPVEGTDVWTVVIDGSVISVSGIQDLEGTPYSNSDEIPVGEVFKLALGTTIDLTEPHDIAVYGPYSTRARAGYSP